MYITVYVYISTVSEPIEHLYIYIRTEAKETDLTINWCYTRVYTLISKNYIDCTVIILHTYIISMKLKAQYEYTYRHTYIIMWMH